MLQVTIQQNGKTQIKNLIVIDGHSHMGKDVDGAEMMNPMAPGTGTFDFWTKIESRIRNDWDEGKSDQSFNANVKGVPSKISLDFVQSPFVTNLFQSLEKRNQSGRYTEAYERIQHQKLIDQCVVFPFQDQFRDKKPEALYRASNTNIHRQTSKFPVSLRMFGYMRCDPMEGEKAIKEIEYWGQQPSNIRGLKLHPRSEGWIDNISSNMAIQALVAAAKNNWPVIFDTRGKQSILDIADLIRSARNTIQSQNPELLPNFKVIIAHAGQGNVDDAEVYRAITQPNTWMDLSMLHGQGAERFLVSFQTWCRNNQIEEQRKRRWSEFCLFATDYPYFGDQHAKELIVYLFNKSFFENGGTIEDTANILGLNQLRLLAEYSPAFVNTPYNNIQTPVSTFLQGTSILPPNFPKAPSPPLSEKQLMFDTLATLIDDDVFNIQSLLYQFDQSWDLSDDYCLITQSNQDPNKIVPLFYTKLADQLSLLGTVPKTGKWNKFGFESFSTETQSMMNQIYAHTFPSAIPEDAAKMIKQVY